ncbi:MAG: glutamate--cysteine ligase [Gammaproteobacteria bacterium]|nr:MAG: glutamate--cysteine ligase [Gammaproteobacteria bacterium]
MQPAHNIIPHLQTALTGPLQDIERHILDNQSRIEAWFAQQWKQTPAPFYSSVDLRNAGFKIAPVDTNLFPAGFNNLNPESMPLCIQATQSALDRYEASEKVLIIPENHTRNRAYFASLAALVDILTKAGCDVRIGSLLPDLEHPMEIPINPDKRITLHPLLRTEERVHIENFMPDLIILNNDLTEGIPDLIKGITQPITPSKQLGWWNRSKSAHFEQYHAVAEEFSQAFSLDPWLISPLHRQCGKIDFMNRTGVECLEKNVAALLEEIRKKYAEYRIDQEPFVVIKADSGTYGMGVMIAHSTDDIKTLNRKQRTRMAASKGGQHVTRVILQEGVYTFESVSAEQSVAEPVVYMLNHFVVGGFYRIHKDRGPNENLNAPGMHFEPLAFTRACIAPEPDTSPDAPPNRFYTYGVMARLALVAAAREMQEVSQ